MKNKIAILIGKEMKIARMKKNITQEQIGNFIGVTRQTVSLWESGKRSMNIEDYVKICDHFGFDAQNIIDNVMEMVKDI